MKRHGAPCHRRQRKGRTTGPPAARETSQARSLSASIRQLETVAFWCFLAARRFWRVRLALAAHARKDDDLSARRLGAVARLSARVPRTEVKNHSHCVPLAGRCAPRPPRRITRTQLRRESTYLTATGVNGLLMRRRRSALVIAPTNPRGSAGRAGPPPRRSRCRDQNQSAARDRHQLALLRPAGAQGRPASDDPRAPP